FALKVTCPKCATTQRLSAEAPEGTARCPDCGERSPLIPSTPDEVVKVVEGAGAAPREALRPAGPLGGMLPAGRTWGPATLTLAAVNVLVFVLVAVGSSRWLEVPSAALVKWGAACGLKGLDGQPWRAVTSLFLHAGLLHLAGNMLFLLLVGGVVERLL